MSITRTDEAMIMAQLRIGRLIRGEEVELTCTLYKLNDQGELLYKYEDQWVKSSISVEEFLQSCQCPPKS